MTVSRLKMDTSGWEKGLAQLAGPLKTSLARSMAVAGGEILRDEAKLHAPKKSGLLAESIYLAFKDGRSTEDRVIYSVSWNHLLAPHGHLLEFGHWLVLGGKLDKGGVKVKWVPAHPFLRPAMSAAPRAQKAMIERGRQRLPELLAEQNSGN